MEGAIAEGMHRIYREEELSQEGFMGFMGRRSCRRRDSQDA